MRSDYIKLLPLLNGSLSLYTSDADPGKQIEEEITKRDKEYSDLLKSYVSISKARNIIREIHKWLFFWIIVIAGYFSFRIAYCVITKIVNSDDLNYIVETIPIVVAAFVSFTATIISIPLAITNFLFNTKEDDNITDIVKHTQEHDAAGLSLFKERFIRVRSNPLSKDTTGDNIRSDGDS